MLNPLDPEVFKHDTGIPDFHAKQTIQLGDLIEDEIFTWERVNWKDAAYNESQYNRLCELFEAKFWLREISFTPIGLWMKRLRLELTYNLMPKYKPLYNQLEDGDYDPLQTGGEYRKERKIESDFPETLLSQNQDYASKSLNASGKFTLIRRTSAKTGYEVILDGFYSNNGHSLNVSPGMKQTVGQDNMRVRGGIGSFRKMNLKGVLLSPRLAFDYRRNALASDLTGVVTELRTSNDIAFDVLKVSPSVDASYNTTRLNAYLSLPLSYEYMALSGNERMTKHSILPEPTLSMSYVFSSVLDGEMSYGFVRTAKDIATLYDGLIMRNYRTLTAYQPDLTRGYSNTFSAKLNYKDVFKMMFAGAGVYYSLGRPKVLYGYNYDGIYAEAVGMWTDELSHSVRAEVDFSKGFHWANTTVKAEVDVIVSEHPYLAQDRITRTRSNVVQLGVYLTMEPWKWMNLSYSGEVMRSQSLQPDGESFPVLYTGRNDLNLRFRLPYHFSVGTVVDNYINGRATGKKSFTLIDAEVHYEYRKMKWTLSCRNLLGVREYGYSRMSGGTDFFSSYMIRPREFMLKLMITI